MDELRPERVKGVVVQRLRLAVAHPVTRDGADVLGGYRALRRKSSVQGEPHRNVDRRGWRTTDTRTADRGGCILVSHRMDDLNSKLLAGEVGGHEGEVKVKHPSDLSDKEGCQGLRSLPGFVKALV